MKTYDNTQRGRSRWGYARDCEVDIVQAKYWERGHLQRWKGEGQRDEPTFSLWFLGRRGKDANVGKRRADPKFWDVVLGG